MKTVQQYLMELDTDKLLDQYFFDYPIDYGLFLHKELTVAQIRQRHFYRTRQFIHHLCELTIKENEDKKTCILLAYRIVNNDGMSHDIDCALVYKDDVLKNGSDAQVYAFLLTEQREIVGFLVSDNEFTLRHIYELMANVLHEATFFGYDEETQRKKIEETIESFENAKECDAIPFEKIKEEFQTKYGIEPDEETSDEKELRFAVLDAVKKYNDHCLKKELETLVSGLRSDISE